MRIEIDIDRGEQMNKKTSSYNCYSSKAKEGLSSEIIQEVFISFSSYLSLYSTRFPSLHLLPLISDSQYTKSHPSLLPRSSHCSHVAMQRQGACKHSPFLFPIESQLE